MYPVRRIVVLAVAGLLVVTGGTAFALAQSDHHTHGQARAVAADKAMLADAPTLASAVPSPSAPVKRLKAAPELPGYYHLVGRAKYWTVNEPYKQAYTDLTASTPSGFRDDGTGRSGGRTLSDNELDAFYSFKKLPAGIAYAELLVAVTPTSHTTTAIGVYAQAVPQPPRPAKENVPTSVDSVVVSKVRSVRDKHPLQRTITGRRAHALAKAFDALAVDPPGETHCAADFGQSKSATFTAGGNTWTASIGPCPGVAVVRDGQALPRLDISARFYDDLTRAVRSKHPKRPAAEHVPTSLRKVHLARRNEPFGAVKKRRTVTGKRAAALVKSFDALRVEPRNAIHCNVAGGPEDIATFRTHSHTWVATESACSNIVVTRDGKDLPTLVGSKAWEKAEKHYLGR
jgi:hypothetical protein